MTIVQSSARRGVDRPRVLLSVHSAGRGGAERLAAEEARHLARHYELWIAFPDGPNATALEAVAHRRVRPAPSLPLWGASAPEWAKAALKTLIHALYLTGFVRRHRLAAVLVNSSVSLSPVIAARLSGVPAIVHVRDSPVSRLSGAVFALHGGLAHTLILIAAAMGARFPRARARRVVVHDGIEIPDRQAARMAERFGGPPLRLCVVGAIDPLKGQDVAVEALHRLRAGGTDAELTLVGREQHVAFSASVHAAVAARGLGGHVTFAGELPDIGPALACADVLIAPSRSEWTPLVIMEALLAGVPVVAADVGGVRELLADGAGGVLVAREDPEALALAVAGLAADPGRARALADAGERHVRRAFDLRDTLRGAEAALEQALGDSDGAY